MLRATRPFVTLAIVVAACAACASSRAETSERGGWSSNGVFIVGRDRPHTTSLNPYEPPVYDLTLTVKSPLKIASGGVIRYVQNGRQNFHPVATGQYVLALLADYDHTHRSADMASAVENARDALRHLHHGWAPYPFGYDVGEGYELTAPWYSCMAQGTLLSAFSDLYIHDRGRTWLTAANALMRTLTEGTSRRSDGPGRPGCTFVDRSGYVWFEEYAGGVRPFRVLNGHIFAMFGVYDFYRATRSQTAATLFSAAAATVRHYFAQFRRPGHQSRYALGLKEAAGFYQLVHVRQLSYLGVITKDDAFTRMSAQLQADSS